MFKRIVSLAPAVSKLLQSFLSRRSLYCYLGFLLAATLSARASSVTNKIWAWGSDRYGETDVPPGLSNVLAIAAGVNHSMALKSDGTVVVWGDNQDGETNVPAGLSNVVSIAAGGAHCLALKNDGTVVAWGWNVDGQTDVPPGLRNVVAIAGAENSSMALRSDGSVIAWGGDNQGQLSISSTNFGAPTNIAAIAGGEFTFMALQSNGTVIVSGFPAVVPSGLSNIVAIADGENQFVALKNDGSVVLWDENGNVSAGPSNVQAIVGDYNDSAFLFSNGTVAVWGDDYYGITNVPVGLTNVTAIAGACSFHVLALAPDQSLSEAAPETLTDPAAPGSTNAVLNALVWPDSLPAAAWFEWGTTTNYGNLTPATLVGSGGAAVSFASSITGLTPLTSYNFRVVASNALGYSYGGNASFMTIELSNYINGINITGTTVALWSTAVTSNAVPPSVWITTNFVSWSRLGSAVQTSPGLFQFFDANDTNSAEKFYRLQWP
jgi:hypothetical protein